MRVALFHNRYRERGGEDAVVAAQQELLAKGGHEVRVLAVDNREALVGVRGALRAARFARWNPHTAARVDALLEGSPIDVAHVHNTFPLLSPSLHHALAARGVPVVQSLHNYRLLCANAALLREGRPCEECVTRGPWNAVRHGCYRGSRLQTAVWAELTAHHRRLGTWQRCVDAFVVPSELARDKLRAAGLPTERLHVVPNPVPDPGPPTPGGVGALCLGRLSPEKGVDLLIEAWRRLPQVPLRIAGDGPEEERLRRLACDLPQVTFVGRLAPDAAIAALRAAAFAVVPSRALEVFGLVAAEALACGRPVVVPEGSAMASVVEHGRSGLHFRRGDAASLADACAQLAAEPLRLRALSEEARARYEGAFAPARVLARLEALYASLRRTPGPERAPAA